MGYSKAEEKALKKMRKVRTVRKRIRPKDVLEVDMVGFILADIPEFTEELSSDIFELVVEDDKLYVTFNTRGVHSEDPNVPEEEMTATDAFLEFCAFKKRDATKPPYPAFALDFEDGIHVDDVEIKGKTYEVHARYMLC